MDEQTQKVLALLQMLMEKVDNLEATQQELYDEVINPIRQGKEELKFQDFKDKYSYELEPYADLTKYTEDAGEDFDLYRDVYDKTRDIPEDKMDDYMSTYADQLAEKFDALRAKLGIDPEADIEVKSDAEGQTEVEIKEDEASEAPAEPGEVKEEEKTEEITDENLRQSEGSEAVPEEEEYDEAQDLEELRNAKKNIYE
jgi:hypothetical protein